MNRDLLQNSLLLAVLATAGALALGAVAAVGLACAPDRRRRGWQGGMVAVLALPAFFVAACWMNQLGFVGAWRWGLGTAWEPWLPLLASAAVLSLLLWPITALLLARRLERLDARLLEAWPELRGREFLRHVLLPGLRGAWLAPAAITGVLVLGNFAVPALFQAKVWPAEIWVRFATELDAAGAFRSSLAPAALALALVGLALHHWRRSPMDAPGARPAGPALLRNRLGSGWAGGAEAWIAGVLGLSLVFPVLSALVAQRTWTEMAPALSAAARPAVHSVVYAAGAATLALAGGACLARVRAGAFTVVPFALPGIFLGMLWLFAGNTAAAPAWMSGEAGVILSLAARYLFVGWLAARIASRDADARLAECARLAGGGLWTQWRHVIWPTAGGALLAGWWIVYLLCLWDVETLILTVPPGGESLALVVFNLLHYGHNAQVGALCVVLGGLAIAPGLTALVAQLVRRSATRTGVAAAALVLLATGCRPPDDATSARLDSRLFERVEVIGRRGTGPGTFNKPRSVALDAADRLYVVDMTGRVQRFDTGGRWQLQWQMPRTDQGRPKGMDRAADGTILVVEPHYHRLNQFSTEGEARGGWGTRGTNRGELWFPRAVAATPQGECLISEYGVVERVQRFRLSDGAYLGGFGSPGTGPGEFNRAEGLGLDAAGNVLVADSCNHRIQIFTPDGRFLRQIGRPGQGPGEFSYPYDVRVDHAGFRFVCEFGNSRVQVLDAEDRTVEMLGGPGTAPGEMHNPWSLALDSKGNLYVADAQNHRVLKFVRREGT